MKKKIVIIDSDGRETVVEGNFDKAVNVRLETEPEKYWFNTDHFNARFFTNEDEYWDEEYKIIHAETKKQAVLNYIIYLFKNYDKQRLYITIERHIDLARKELKKYE